MNNQLSLEYVVSYLKKNKDYKINKNYKTFISSLLYLLNINDDNFKTKIIEEINKKKIFTKLELRKLGWTKKVILEYLINNEYNNYLIYFFSLYFNINIIILENDDITAYYQEEKFDKNKKTLIFKKEENNFYPVEENNKFLDNLLKKKISCPNILLLKKDNIVKKFII